jgi:hypothetical protein
MTAVGTSGPKFANVDSVQHGLKRSTPRCRTAKPSWRHPHRPPGSAFKSSRLPPRLWRGIREALLAVARAWVVCWHQMFRYRGGGASPARYIAQLPRSSAGQTSAWILSGDVWRPQRQGHYVSRHHMGLITGDRMVEKAATLDLLDAHTRVTKTNYRLGWPSR